MSWGTDCTPMPGRSGLAAFVALLPLAVAGCGREDARRMPPSVPARVLVPVGRKPSERPVDRGRAIYTGGESPSGRPITARIGEGPAVPAAALACVQCHGNDGRGRPEGGVTPSDITWANLTRPYGIVHPDGRRHPAYTAALFGRAVTMGWDPAGQTLSSAMPRYQLSPEDLNDLIGYIQQIGNVAVRGVSESAIRIGVALPDAAPGGVPSFAVVKALTRYADSINGSGGVFRRRVELVLLAPEVGGDQEIFAAVGGFTPDGDAWSDRLEAARVPLIRVYPAPARGLTTDRQGSFSLVSGHAGQVRALARFASEGWIGKDSKVAVIRGRRSCTYSLAEDLATRLRAAGVRDVTVELAAAGEAAALFDRLTAQRFTAVLLAGPADRELIEELVLTVADRSPQLTILCPETLAGRWLASPPPALAGRLIVAAPVPSWIGAEGAAATAAAQVLVEALKGAGRDLDHEALIKALERVTIVNQSDPLPVTFGPGRRVGLRGLASCGWVPVHGATSRSRPWSTRGQRPTIGRRILHPRTKVGERTKAARIDDDHLPERPFQVSVSLRAHGSSRNIDPCGNRTPL